MGAIALALAVCLKLGPALAISGVGDPPIYNPSSKSYFQLLQIATRHGNWPESVEQAHGQIFKGVHGRLAVIDSPETHDFIMRSFDVSKPIWIGLRYWCEFHLLEWAGHRPFSPSDPDTFQAWHPQWQRNDQICPPNSRGPDSYAVVYYQPLSSRSALWQAVGKGKGFSRLLVEFPTGSE